ncbi:MAG: hypothetical protein AABY47_05070 [Pseudomonadota bacterium]
MMTAKNNIAILLLLLTSLPGAIPHAFATHISKPVLVDPKTEYTLGDTILINGWVEYNGQPAPDVLLNFKLTRPDGTTAIDQSSPSNQEGRFVFRFDAGNQPLGVYQITITSHCLDIHRYACTYQNQILPIRLNAP